MLFAFSKHIAPDFLNKKSGGGHQCNIGKYSESESQAVSSQKVALIIIVGIAYFFLSLEMSGFLVNESSRVIEEEEEAVKAVIQIEKGNVGGSWNT